MKMPETQEAPCPYDGCGEKLVMVMPKLVPGGYDERTNSAIITEVPAERQPYCEHIAAKHPEKFTELCESTAESNTRMLMPRDVDGTILQPGQVIGAKYAT